MRAYRLLTLVSILLVLPPTQALELSASPATSRDGVVKLSWSGHGGEAVVLQQSPSRDFKAARTLYQGTDSASLRSGLSNGEYHFRARPRTSDAWSEAVAVTVSHHPLTTALGYLGVGALVFLATTALIVTGHRRREHSQ